MEFDRASGDSDRQDSIAALGHDQLVDEVIRRAQVTGIVEINPRDGQHIDPFVAEFQSRLQYMDGVEELYAHNIKTTIMESVEKIKKLSAAKKNNFDTLDKLTNNVGSPVAQLDNMNKYGLSKAQQVLFLRGIIIATTARYEEVSRVKGATFSTKQGALQRRALYSLRHIASNHVHVPAEITDESRIRFEIAYSAAYLAQAVELELHAQGGMSYTTTSIDDAMNIPVPFGRLAGGDQAEVVSIFPPGASDVEPSDLTGLKRVHPAEIDEERIAELRNLQHSFGNAQTVFRYYETVQPFKTNGNGERKHPSEPGEPQSEPSEEDDANYIVLVIEHRDDLGERKVHVVADNPKVGNACYALRQEVLEEWERLVGVRLSWRDVFSQSRQTARQLGARPFRHNKGSNVTRRIEKYLSQEEESVILETFACIFDQSAGLFDKRVRPTDKNHMPPAMLELIHKSKTLKELWPSIVAYGYDQTRRTVAAERAASLRKQAAEAEPKEASIRERARQMWAQIVKADIEIGDS